MFEWLVNLSSLEFWEQFIDQIRALGIFAGVGLTMIEAFFPPLPLILFVTVNILAFGFWLGYFYSWLGSCIGSIIVFLLIKKFGQEKFKSHISDNKRLFNTFSWIKEKGFVLIFLLLTFPFTPSIIVCGLAALAGTKNIEYFSALILGKLVMVFSLSFIGANLRSFIQQPIKSILLISITLSLSFIGKYVLQRCERNRNMKLEEVDNKRKVS